MNGLIYWVVVGGAYIILWWMAFFVLLPIGLYSEDDPPGQFVLGAPPRPPAAKKPSGFRWKVLSATAIATAIWAVLYGLVLAGVIQL